MIRKDETPGRRLLDRGAESLTDAELLSILLSGDSEAAGEILDEIGGLGNLDQCTIKGCCERTTILLATVEFTRRLTHSKIPEQRLLPGTGAVVTYLKERYLKDDQEVVGALFLDIRKRLVREVAIFRGSIDRMEPWTILREGLACHAVRIILFHNHPSREPMKRSEDLGFTQDLFEACGVMGIKIWDHFILGAHQWMSTRTEGMIDRRPK